MSYSGQAAVNETYRHLLSGQRDTINLLDQSVDSTENVLQFSDDLDGIQAGSLLSLDLETVYVRTINAAARTANVIRKWLGSTGDAHQPGIPVYVNPRFTSWDIFQALNVELNDLSSPSIGMYAIAETEFLYHPQIQSYDLGVPRAQVQNILEVRYQEPGPAKRWPRVRSYDVLWDTDIPDFPSGTAIRLDQSAWSGHPVRVKYARPFIPMADLTSDLVADCLLPATAIDIPPLGAAAMLMFHKEAKRSFLESQGDTRRAAEVPPGSSTHDAATLLGLRNRRATDEAARISSNYPNYIAR
jgi:hypothetical protein